MARSESIGDNFKGGEKETARRFEVRWLVRWLRRDARNSDLVEREQRWTFYADCLLLLVYVVFVVVAFVVNVFVGDVFIVVVFAAVVFTFKGRQK